MYPVLSRSQIRFIDYGGTLNTVLHECFWLLHTPSLLPFAILATFMFLKSTSF